MSLCLTQLTRWIEHFKMHDWVVLFAVVVALGCYLMRGFGSRKTY